ncbi:MAG: retropepsin-like domain-containing protein [Bryobacteraceae bacterium]|nr:retropepsin-like domain-containing protein [Bryobacteraceae bacterium]
MLLLGLLCLSSVIDTRPAPVYAAVFIGPHGPYRFLVDTGAQVSLIDAPLAAKLGLSAEFQTRIITQFSAQLQPGVKAANLRIGRRTLPPLELVFQDLAAVRRHYPGIQGLLGLDSLAGLNFALLPADGSLELGARRPVGQVIPFERIEDRIAIKTRMGSETLTLILDSGSTHVVLFRTPVAMAKTRPVKNQLGTLEGARAVVPTTWTPDRFFIGKLRIDTQPAAIVERPGSQVDGLVPAAIFQQVYVDQARQELVLVR